MGIDENRLDNDPDFKRFCVQLEEVKGTAQLYQPDKRWLDKILAQIRSTEGQIESGSGLS